MDEVLPGPRVSRRHFRLEPVPGDGHLLVDLGSANGTLVNDRRVASALLQPFDRVRVGDHLLVYLDPATSAGKVIELLSPGETGELVVGAGKSQLVERLLGLTLMVQERGSELELVSTLDEVLEELLGWTGHTRGLILAEDGSVSGGAQLRVVHARQVPGELLSEQGLSGFGAELGPALTGSEVQRLATRLGPDTLCVPLDSRPTAERRRTQHPGQVHGALLLAGRRGAWSPSAEEARLLRGLARQIALVIASARLERQVTTDPLTDLTNRAYLERLLGEALLDARAGGTPVGVILVDLDDFKRVNDTLGHAKGDEVLRHVADRLRWALRHTDSAGRWGGEEFLVVLPGTDLAGAAQVADKVVQLVGSSCAPHGLTVTISAGVAAAPEHGLEASQLLERADQALYAAKRAGKNRYRVWAPARVAEPATGAVTQRLDPTSLRAESALPELDALAVEPPVAWLDCDLLPTIPLHPGTTLLGRNPACEVVLPHRSVSRQHGLLHVTPEGQVTFEDCSLNGSYVNGEVAVDPVVLRPGDRLGIGPYALVLRLERRGDALDTTPAAEMIGGRLEDAHLCSFLLHLEGSRATGTLAVHSDALEGELRLRRGQPVSAHAGAAEDLEAVRLLLSQERGAYAFVHGPSVIEPSRIPLTTSGLLLLACPHAAAGAPGQGCPRSGCKALETTKAARQHLTC